MSKDEKEKTSGAEITTPENKENASGVGTTTPDNKEKTTTDNKEETTNVVKKGNGKKTVVVEEDLLKKLIDTVEKQRQDIEDLKGAADIGRLSRIQDARNSGKLIKTAKVNIWEGKVVLGWVSGGDEVYFDEAGRLHEDQSIKLIIGKDKEGQPIFTDKIPYRTFSRVVTKLEGEVIKESKGREGETYFTILLDDGREIELPIQFIN